MSNKYLNAISSLDNNVFIDIEVSPNSNKFQISGFNEWRNRFEIRIKQVPQKGKANKEIVKELSRLNDMSLEIQKQMNDGLTRVDESNRFLREQNTRQSEQNAQILQAVIKGNESSDEHQFQLKLLDKTNFWKLTIGIGGSAAAIFAALTEIIKVIFK